MIHKVYIPATDTYKIYMDDVNHISISGHVWGKEALEHYFGPHAAFVEALPIE